MNVSKGVSRPLCQYLGGKWKMAPWIVENMPPHVIYVEPFGGAASVLLRKPVVPVEVYNDLDKRVVNVFRVLRDPEKKARLLEMLALTPYAKEEVKACWNVRFDSRLDDVTRAWVFLVLAHQLLSSTSSSKRKSFPGWECRAYDKKSFKYLTTCFARLPTVLSEIAARMKNVMLDCRNAFDLFDIYDRNDRGPVLFYVDPPYLGTARYEISFTEVDHVRLVDKLLAVKSMVMLSAYPNEFYTKRLKGWSCITKQAYDTASNKKTECLWLNPQAREGLDKMLSQNLVLNCNL